MAGMQTQRFGLSFVLGAIVAFLLFVLMAQLIRMGDAELDNSADIKIADITMPDTEIEAKLDEELPDKPDEVEAPPPEMEAQDLEVDVPDNALNVSSGGGQFNPDIGIGGGFARDTDFIPVYVPQPRYPSRAERSGKAGYAVVEVTVTTSGGVRDVKLMEEWPENYGFGKSAAKAASKLKYNPRVVNGVAVEVPGVLYKFSFTGFADKKR